MQGQNNSGIGGKALYATKQAGYRCYRCRGRKDSLLIGVWQLSLLPTTPVPPFQGQNSSRTASVSQTADTQSLSALVKQYSHFSMLGCAFTRYGSCPSTTVYINVGSLLWRNHDFVSSTAGRALCPLCILTI
jgi:hypothetical protein